MTARLDRAAVALLLIAVAGVAVSIYLTVVHYAGAELACVTTGAIDCAAVTTSSYSLVPGTAIPISLPGLLWFVASGAAAVVVLRGDEPAWLAPAHLVWAAAGVLVVLYLVYAELVVINRICEWCTVLHVLILATFFLAIRRMQGAEPA